LVFWVSPDGLAEARAKKNFTYAGDGDVRLCNK
jgi:hypothetical protein